MAEIVRRRSWGGVLPCGLHASISGSSLIHCAFVSIAPSSSQEGQNARIQKRFKLEQALDAITRIIAAGERFEESYAGRFSNLIERLRGLEEKDLVSMRIYTSSGIPTDIYSQNLTRISH